MKSLLIAALVVITSQVAFAKLNPAVEKAILNLKTKDVRTVTKEVENKVEENPCLPDGKSYVVDLQVRQAKEFNHEKGEIIYSWETVKTISVDKDGSVMEMCVE